MNYNSQESFQFMDLIALWIAIHLVACPTKPPFLIYKIQSSYKVGFYRYFPVAIILSTCTLIHTYKQFWSTHPLIRALLKSECESQFTGAPQCCGWIPIKCLSYTRRHDLQYSLSLFLSFVPLCVKHNNDLIVLTSTPQFAYKYNALVPVSIYI